MFQPGPILVAVTITAGSIDQSAKYPHQQGSRHEESHDGRDQDEVSHASAPVLEPLGLEHRDSQINERRQQDALDDSHFALPVSGHG
jgi:hypothetical protein